MTDRIAEDMKRVAELMARVACFNSELEGMKAENMNRAQRGESMAYGEEQFYNATVKHGIDHNSVISLLRHY
jgi:uncharacterized small protein (DUF1192 family)